MTKKNLQKQKLLGQFVGRKFTVTPQSLMQHETKDDFFSLILDDGAEAFPLVEGVDGIVGLLHSLKVVGDVVVDWQLRKRHHNRFEETNKRTNKNQSFEETNQLLREV